MMQKPLTDDLRKALRLANATAQRLNHTSIELAHLLLGILADSHAMAASVLRNLEVDVDACCLELENSLQSGNEEVLMGKLPQSPAVQRAVREYAGDEVRSLKHDCLGTGHLLLGVLREQESGAARTLRERGLTLEAVRAEVVRLSETAVDCGEMARTAAFPDDVRQQVRQSISSVWNCLPHENRNPDELERQVLRLVERALGDFRTELR